MFPLVAKFFPPENLFAHPAAKFCHLEQCKPAGNAVFCPEGGAAAPANAHSSIFPTHSSIFSLSGPLAALPAGKRVQSEAFFVLQARGDLPL